MAQGTQDNQIKQENVVEVTLEEVAGDYDEERWQVVDQSTGQGMIGIGAAENLPSGVQYRLALCGDFEEGDLVLVRQENEKGRKTYFFYQVRDGQLQQWTNGLEVDEQLGKWMFHFQNGLIHPEGIEAYYIKPGECGYFETLKGNWPWDLHLLTVTKVAEMDESISSAMGADEDAVAGRKLFTVLDQLIKAKQQAEQVTEVVQNVFGIVSQLLEPEIFQNQLAALVKSRESTIQGPAGRVVNQLHEIANACQKVDPNLQLPEKHLRPKKGS